MPTPRRSRPLHGPIRQSRPRRRRRDVHALDGGHPAGDGRCSSPSARGFVQFRRLPEAVRTMVATQQAGAGGALSPFQAFMTGLAATIGVGNIAGVATAIISGGPGRPVLDLVLRLHRHGDEVLRGGARPEVPHRPRRADARRADVLPARRPGLAGARVDLRADRRRGVPVHHAVHAAQFDRRGARQPAHAARRRPERSGRSAASRSAATGWPSASCSPCSRGW